jgi:hypothetical protein
MNTIHQRGSGWKARYGYCPTRGFYVDVYKPCGGRLVMYDCRSDRYDAARPLEGALWTLVTLEFLDGARVEEVLRQPGTSGEPRRKGLRRTERVLQRLQDESLAA